MIFAKIVYYKTVESTNNELSKLVREEKIQDNFVLVADYQNKGKGQRGNKWHSARNKNLLFSLYLKSENFLIKHKVYFNIITSISIVYTLKKYITESQIQIKWPNDILIDGQKISGILIETSVLKEKIQKVILGCGINVNQKRFPFKENNPTSISQILNCDVDRYEVLDLFLKNFDKFFCYFKKGDYEFLDKEYLKFMNDPSKFSKNYDAKKL